MVHLRVFININSIDDSIIFLLQKFVDFCKKKNHTLEHYESFITPKILPEKEYKEYNFIETKWETKQNLKEIQTFQLSMSSIPI